MKLSVLMPVYNEEKWLPEIVKRVLKQAVAGISDLEIIIVDDASQDGTKVIIDELVMKYKNKIVPVVKKRNEGKGAALRTAIEKMKE